MNCDSWFGLGECRQQIPRIGEAGFGVADEGLVDGGGEVFLQPRHAFAEGDGVFVEDDVDGVALGIEAVGEFPGEELVKGGGEAPDIGDGFYVFEVGDLLRGHEDGGTGVLAGDAHAGKAGDLEILGEAEVGDLGDVAVDEDVVRLDVAVHEALLVRGGESFERLDGPWHEDIRGDGAAARLGGIGQRAAIAVFHNEEKGALIGTAVEEADDVRVPESGDDFHLALELIDGAGIGLGAGKHEFHGHRVAAGFAGGEIDRAATAAPKLALDAVAGQGEENLLGAAEDQAVHRLGREAGEIAFRQGGLHKVFPSHLIDAHFDGGFPDGDEVAVLEIYAGILAKRTLFRGLAFFAATAFFSVQVGAVHAAEIAECGLGRADLQQEMMAGNLRIARNAKVAIFHATEQKGIVLGKGEGLRGAI